MGGFFGVYPARREGKERRARKALLSGGVFLGYFLGVCFRGYFESIEVATLWCDLFQNNPVSVCGSLRLVRPLGELTAARRSAKAPPKGGL